MLKNGISLFKASLKHVTSLRCSFLPYHYPPSMIHLRAPTNYLSQIPSRTFHSVTDDNSAANTSIDFKSPTRSKSANTGPDVSDFTVRIKNKLLVVDKTAELHDLIQNRTSAFVMGPRRFGKTLNSSTVKAIFENGAKWWKDNCPDFAIVKSNYNFPVRPVLYFDFSGIVDLRELQDRIITRLLRNLKESKLLEPILQLKKKRYEKYKSRADFFDLFEAGIMRLSEQEGIVLIIDEYDSPITCAVEKMFQKLPDCQEQELLLDSSIQEITSFLKDLFTRIKYYRAPGGPPYITFFYLTGCVPLSQMGLFSGPNDVFVSRRFKDYYKIIGYTKEEIMTAFAKNIDDAARLRYQNELAKLSDMSEKLAQEEGIKVFRNKIMDEIAENYDGFIFEHDQENALYSPFAINCLFETWKNSLAITDYPAFFSASGSSTLIWRSIKRMTLEARTKLYWSLINNEESQLSIAASSQQMMENQPIGSLYSQVEKIGYFSGLFSVDKTTSNSKVLHLKITNKEMKEAYLIQLANVIGLQANLTSMLGFLSQEDYCNYFDLLNRELKNLSAFTPSQKATKHKLEVEAYGHTIFALLHERLGKYVEEQRELCSFTKAKVECIKDKAISISRNRPDCLILIDGLVPKESDINKKDQEKSIDNGKNIDPDIATYKKICIVTEFKCYDDVNAALKEAKKDLIRKKDDFKNLRKIYCQLADYEQIFVAGALGFGVLKSLEFYKLEKEELVQFSAWTESGEIKEN